MTLSSKEEFKRFDDSVDNLDSKPINFACKGTKFGKEFWTKEELSSFQTKLSKNRIPNTTRRVIAEL